MAEVHVIIGKPRPSNYGVVKILKTYNAVVVPQWCFKLSKYSVTNFGFLPFRTPVDTVVGAPIDVPQILEPTNEDVDRVHRQYCEALTELFEEHKIHFGVSEDTRLILV
ncbi:diacylglycerol acyltransferase [Teladorsagia circumcincta]|uniref:diacylglycerol O-acyltransferase n=1 Tax=Teladorsagia circumcincta TaxID=45464 RepID=A0A2G9UGU6_TELCI|nr:diacylglycerol acyltransferase [Teladorsagia circumcincta]